MFLPTSHGGHTGEEVGCLRGGAVSQAAQRDIRTASGGFSKEQQPLLPALSLRRPLFGNPHWPAGAVHQAHQRTAPGPPGQPQARGRCETACSAGCSPSRRVGFGLLTARLTARCHGRRSFALFNREEFDERDSKIKLLCKSRAEQRSAALPATPRLQISSCTRGQSCLPCATFTP